MRIKTEIVFSWKPSEESVSEKEWLQERSDQGWAPLPPHPLPLDCPIAPALSALHHESNLHWSSILHMIIYIFQCYSLISSHPHLLPHSPNVCWTLGGNPSVNPGRAVIFCFSLPLFYLFVQCFDHF